MTLASYLWIGNLAIPLQGLTLEGNPMKRDEFISVVDMAWDDVRLHGEGTEIGIAIVIIHKDGDHLVTQLGSNLPPAIARFALETMVRAWREPDAESFEEVVVGPRDNT
jgi:hypothetical protein